LLSAEGECEEDFLDLRLTQGGVAVTLVALDLGNRSRVGTSVGSPFGGEGQQQLSKQLPRVWIGYLLSLATLAAMIVAVEKHPELASGELVVPPLYLFLAGFVTLVYWLVCVHRMHVVLAHVPEWKHPVSPVRAVGFHFIPIYSLYWLYKWPGEVARFVNSKLGRPALNPAKAGLFVFVSYAACLVLGPGGLLLLFVCLAYLNEWIRRALAGPGGSRGDSRTPA